jgi:hypothetical protein
MRFAPWFGMAKKKEQAMVEFDRLRRIKVHDDVAVLCPCTSGPEVLDIAQVKHIGHVLIQTSDDQFYSVYDGESIDNRHIRYIEPATTAHRMALNRRRGAAADKMSLHSA